MEQKPEDTRTWPELAIGLFDQLTGRGAEISYVFENMEVHVPSSTAANAEHALCRVNGTMRIRTSGATMPPRA